MIRSKFASDIVFILALCIAGCRSESSKTAQVETADVDDRTVASDGAARFLVTRKGEDVVFHFRGVEDAGQKVHAVVVNTFAGKGVCKLEVTDPSGPTMDSTWTYGTVPTNYRAEHACADLSPENYDVYVDVGSRNLQFRFEIDGKGVIKTLPWEDEATTEMVLRQKEIDLARHARREKLAGENPGLLLNDGAQHPLPPEHPVKDLGEIPTREITEQ